MVRRLRRVCAWCKKMAADGQGWDNARWLAPADASVTHGICPSCAARIE